MLNTLFCFMLAHPALTIFGTVTIIQIAPIKIDPWKWITNVIRKALLGDIQKSIDDLKKDFVEETINNKRWNVLDFANSCRQGRKHTKEEWEHCIEELKWYEDYCAQHKIPNGVMEECAKYLRSVYHDRLNKNDFLN